MVGTLLSGLFVAVSSSSSSLSMRADKAALGVEGSGTGVGSVLFKIVSIEDFIEYQNTTCIIKA